MFTDDIVICSKSREEEKDRGREVEVWSGDREDYLCELEGSSEGGWV